VIGSHHFNENPQPLNLQGALENNRFLFDRLNELETHMERAEFFRDYMSVKFNLHHWERQKTPSARASVKNSYLRFLKGWMIDSNSIAGAVLKQWVERRIGIPPTYHNITIDSIYSDAYDQYMQDALSGMNHTNAIESQLDLLYEYCQFELRKLFPDTDTITLYRGTHDAEEYEILENCGKREQIVRLNNLVSFTNEPERAWEFGRTVWRTSAPLTKVFFYGDLLTGSLMKGESEFVIIGGEYRVYRMR